MCINECERNDERKSVFVCSASDRERERERNSSSSDLCDCKDTKKAIEGIKVVLVIEPDWNLEHWTTTV